MSVCVINEELTGGFPIHGTLYLNPPLGHTLEKMRSSLRAAGLCWSEPAERVLAIDVLEARDGLLGSPLEESLSPLELANTKCVVLPSGHPLGIADLARTQSLGALLARHHAQWLVQLLDDRLLLTYFQPIVRCQSPGEVFGYECLLRGMADDGQLVPAPQLYAAARASGLLFQLDRQARLQHVRAAADRGIMSHVFINFNPTAIYDPTHCLRSTVDAVETAGLDPARLVFEVVECEQSHDLDRLLRIFEYFRAAGFRVALDDFGGGYNSVNLLTRLRPDFVKLDMRLVRCMDRDGYEGQLMGKILQLARQLDVQTIVEGIETAQEFATVQQHGADFAQGFLFGYPNPQPQPPLSLVRATSRS